MSDKVDWAVIRNVDVKDYYTIAHTQGPRSIITVFGKIGFVDLTFTPTNNLNDVVMRLPDSLGIKPLYLTELVARIGETDIRRGIIALDSSNHTVISVNAHPSSAGKFTAIFGMFFLE